MVKKLSRLLKSKRGAALIVAMLLLIILTVLGLAAIKTSTTDIEISANERRAQCALYAADAGLQVTQEQICRYDTDPISPTAIGNNASFMMIGPISRVGTISTAGGYQYKLFGFRIRGICGDPNDPRAPQKEIEVKSRSLTLGAGGGTNYNVGL